MSFTFLLILKKNRFSFSFPFQLKNLDIPDPNDRIFENHDSDFDISKRLDTLSSYSEIYQRRMEKGIPREKLIDKDAVRRAIIRKKYMRNEMGYVKMPNLLTWMEKQMIIKLHIEDPVTWSYDQLSEHFPAPPVGIRNIIKHHKRYRKPDEIMKHDENAQNNWKLLNEGKLENCQNTLEHLQKMGQKSIPMKVELEQSILKEYHETRQQRNKPKLTGEFGTLLVQHKKRLGIYQEEESEENIDENIVMPNLLDSDTDFVQSLNEPSPYGGSTTINAESKSKINTKKLNIDQFRGKFFQEMKQKAKRNEPGAKQYFQWLKTEQSLFEQAEPSKIDVNSSIVSSDDKLYPADKVIEKYAEPESQQKNLVKLDKYRKLKENFSNDIVWKIEIPKHQYKEDATYQVGNSFYDSNGNFSYRIPGMS